MYQFQYEQIDLNVPDILGTLKSSVRYILQAEQHRMIKEKANEGGHTPKEIVKAVVESEAIRMISQIKVVADEPLLSVPDARKKKRSVRKSIKKGLLGPDESVTAQIDDVTSQ